MIVIVNRTIKIFEKEFSSQCVIVRCLLFFGIPGLYDLRMLT